MIPDESEEFSGELKISNRALIFLQKATLACLNRVAKKQFFLHYCRKYPVM